MLLTIKDLSAWLNIKPSTLYLWAAQGKIPCQKIHGLIRFDRERVLGWLESFNQQPPKPVPSFTRATRTDVDQLIEAAKRDAYTPRHGETISPSPSRKEEKDGAR
jgi:excisionase family DNA binding protein